MATSTFSVHLALKCVVHSAPSPSKCGLCLLSPLSRHHVLAHGKRLSPRWFLLSFDTSWCVSEVAQHESGITKSIHGAASPSPCHSQTPGPNCHRKTRSTFTERAPKIPTHSSSKNAVLSRIFWLRFFNSTITFKTLIFVLSEWT